MTTDDRVALGLAAFAGALIGAVLVVPVGQLTYDGPPSCGDQCTYTSTTLLIGLHVQGAYPLWLPLVTAAIFATIAVVIVRTFRD